MKRLATLVLVLAALVSNSAAGWVIKETKQDEDFVLSLNDGGSQKTFLKGTGSTGAVTIGAIGETAAHTINGNTLQVTATGATAVGAVIVNGGTGAGDSRLTLQRGGVNKWLINAANDGPGGTDGLGWYNFTTYVGGISPAGTWTIGSTTGGGAEHLVRSGGQTNLSINSPTGNEAVFNLKVNSSILYQLYQLTSGTLQFKAAGTTVVAEATSAGEWTIGAATASTAINIRMSSSNAVNESAIRIDPGQAGATQPIRWYDTDDNEQWAIGNVANSGNGSFAFIMATGSTNLDFQATEPAMRVRAQGGLDFNKSTGAIKIGDGSGTNVRVGFYMDNVGSGQTCNLGCGAAETTHGFTDTSGTCLMAWNRTNALVLSCANADAVAKSCLCMGANQL